MSQLAGNNDTECSICDRVATKKVNFEHNGKTYAHYYCYTEDSEAIREDIESTKEFIDRQAARVQA